MSEDEQGTDLVQQAVAELYGGVSADFVARRGMLVKTARSHGDKQAAKEIARLRKPSVAAAALNAVVRQRSEMVERLRHLGSRLRHAQSTLDSPGLQALRPERDEVLAALVAVAGEVCGGLTAAAEAEVRDTAIAALADLRAEEVAWSGALTRALSYSGFGEVDVADAVAQTSTGVRLARITGGAASEGEDEGEAGDEDEVRDEAGAEAGVEAAAEAAARAQQEAERITAAEQAVVAAERELGAVLAELDQARNRAEATAKRVAKLTGDLATARAEQQGAAEALD